MLASCAWHQVIISDVETGEHMQTTQFQRGSLEYLSFSHDGSYVETEKGEFPIKTTSTNSSTDPGQGRNHWRIDGEWIMEGDRKMLWLPPLDRFRHNMLCHNGQVAMSGDAGELRFWELTKDKRLTETC